MSNKLTIKQLLKENLNIDKITLQHWLCDCLGKNYSFLITHEEYILTDREISHYYQGLKQLQAGKPLAYITGKQAFWKTEFLVNEHTLIPRPDTEILIETILSQTNQQKLLNLLDLGTGTGCIAISLANEQPDWQITATDISPFALEIAKKNAENHQVAINFLHGHWFEPLSKDKKFDVIVSNPPYISKDDKHLLYLKYEPMTALVADKEGLADIVYLIENAKQYLVDNGLLLIEHGYNQGKIIQQYFKENNYHQVTTIKDYGGNDRVTLGRFLS